MAVITRQAFVCTPSSLLHSTPCIACISEKEMLAVIVGIMALATDTSIAYVLKSSACFSCMSKKDMLQALVTIIGNDLLGDTKTVQEVIDAIRCLECAPEKQLLAAILYQICNNFTITTRGLQ